jgi:hypothetical protein
MSTATSRVRSMISTVSFSVCTSALDRIG